MLAKGIPKQTMPKNNTVSKSTTSISIDWPVWYDPAAPLGSAVRHIASLSAKIHWVHLDVVEGNSMKAGPRIGDPSLTEFPESVKQFLLGTRKGLKLGQLRVGCTHLQPEVEHLIQSVIDEWISFWPMAAKKKN